MPQLTTGLVLSGGGVRGLAHAGLLKAFVENDVQLTHLSGSSAGAMVGALYAAGYQPDEILEFFLQNSNIFTWRRVSVNSKPGILNAEKYVEMFEPWLRGHTFESLNLPLYICVTDVLRGKIRYFSSGELVRPILASAAIPGVFTPVDIDGNWYVDGGTMNNFPIEPMKGTCDVLLGSYVSVKKELTKSELTNTLQLITRANELSFYSGSLSKFKQCDFVFAPPELGDYWIFDTKKIKDIFEIGYRFATEQMERLQVLLE